MEKRNLFLLALICPYIISCHHENKNENLKIPSEVLERATYLKSSVYGDLKFKDSFQIQSARFLLDNLTYQKSSNGARIEAYSDLINKNYKNQDSLLAEIKKVNGILPIENQSFDALHINKGILVDNINFTYNTFLKCGWKNKISLETYCEYLLPYKVNNEPFTKNWKKLLQEQFFKENDPSFFQNDIFSAATQIHSWLYSKKKNYKLLPHDLNVNVPDLSGDLLNKLYFGSCHEISAEGVSYMRAMGIPAAVDFTPTYLNVAAGHEWSVVIQDPEHIMPFDFTATKTRIITNKFFLFAKVYRRMTNPEPESHFMQRGNCPLLPEFINNPNIKDVTQLYTKTSNIEIPITKKTDSQFAYICVFNVKSKSWDPVGWGKISNSSVSFKNLGRGGIYLPAISESNGAFAINSPFLLTDNGTVRFLDSKPSKVESVKLNRTVGNVLFNQRQENRMVNGEFQGSHTSDFKKPVTLYKIENKPGYSFNEIAIPHSLVKPFRYVRYYSPLDSHGNVAEIEFYQSGTDIPANGRVIGTEGSWLNDSKYDKNAAFDGNIFTSFDSKTRDHSWVGLDLKTSKKINKIRFIARQDLNIVQKGNLYELFYWDKNWVSLGKKIAQQTSLVYSNVPINSLLWLRNLSTNGEERIFTYQNGKQIWW